jgi:dsRNA-specific ribonuclease
VKSGEDAVVGKVVNALVGALYLEKVCPPENCYAFDVALTYLCVFQGREGVKSFMNAHVFSRSVDVAAHLKLQNPKFLLKLIVESQGKPRPVAR